MDHLPLLNSEILLSELNRLYERRLVVDELIRSLERYAAYESRCANEMMGKNFAVVNTSRTH